MRCVLIVTILVLSACNEPFDFSMEIGNDVTASPGHTTRVNGVVVDQGTMIVSHFDDFEDALRAPPVLIDVMPSDGSAPLHESFDMNYCQQYCAGSSEPCGNVDVLKSTDLQIAVDKGQSGTSFGINVWGMSCTRYDGADFSVYN